MCPDKRYLDKGQTSLYFFDVMSNCLSYIMSIKNNPCMKHDLMTERVRHFNDKEASYMTHWIAVILMRFLWVHTT